MNNKKAVHICTLKPETRVTTGCGVDRAIVLGSGPMGTRVQITANYKLKAEDGHTLGSHVWSNETDVYVVGE